jgi:hypothetical protein
LFQAPAQGLIAAPLGGDDLLKCDRIDLHPFSQDSVSVRQCFDKTVFW